MPSPLRIYEYRLEDVWPSDKPRPGAIMRLDDQVEKVSDPDAADFFIVPVPIWDYEYHHVDPRSMVPHLERKPERHCFLEIADDIGDHDRLFGSCVWFFCNMNLERKTWHKNAVPIPWPVADLSECVPLPDGGLKYDVSFQGWVTPHHHAKTRVPSVDSCRRIFGERAYLRCIDTFYGYRESTEQGKEDRRTYLESLRASRVSLCGGSIPGVFPYRFWEAMSAGRIPALICDGCVFPFADRIPYKEFCIFIPEAEAGRSGEIIQEWLSGKNDDEIIARGALGRRHWEQWLDSNKWPSTMRVCLEEIRDARMEALA